MGGIGSGKLRTLSDEERMRRGTFRESGSEAASLAKAAEKIVIGPWLTAVQEPEVPLKAEGLKKYNEIAELLLNQNKLTQVTRSMCELLAVMHQQMHARLSAGKSVSSDLMKRIEALYTKLRIAADAPKIASPGDKNRFAGSGFSNQRSQAYRLRPYPSSDSGEL